METSKDSDSFWSCLSLITGWVYLLPDPPPVTLLPAFSHHLLSLPSLFSFLFSFPLFLFSDLPSQPSVTPPTSAVPLVALPSSSPLIAVTMPTAVVVPPPSPLAIPVGVVPTIVSPPPPPTPPVPTPVPQPLATVVPIISVVTAPPDTPMEAPVQVLVIDGQTQRKKKKRKLSKMFMHNFGLFLILWTSEFLNVRMPRSSLLFPV